MVLLTCGTAVHTTWAQVENPSSKIQEHLGDCMKLVVLGSGDKAGQVREAASKVVTALLQVRAEAVQLGYTLPVVSMW